VVEDMHPPPPASTPLLLVKPRVGLSKTNSVCHIADSEYCVMLLGVSL
jgi:hypothetical protein